MNAIYRVFRYEFMRNFRRRGYLFFTFIMPILALILIPIFARIGGTAIPTLPTPPTTAQPRPPRATTDGTARATAIAGTPAASQRTIAPDSTPGSTIAPDGTAVRPIASNPTAGSNDATSATPTQRFITATPQPTPTRERSPFGDGGTAGLVDLSGLITKTINIDPFVRYADTATAEAAAKDGTIVSYYVIPADYVKTGRLEVWMVRFSPDGEKDAELRPILTRALAAQLGNVDPGVLTLLLSRRPDYVNHRVNESGTSETANFLSSFGLAIGFALAFLVGVFLSSSLLMQSVVEERETRIVEILLSSVRPGQLLIGKIVGLGLLGLIQLTFWGVLLAIGLRQVAAILPNTAALTITPMQLAVLIIYYVLGYLLFAAFFAAVGAVSTSMREGPQLATVFTLPAMIPLYLTSTLTAQPDGGLAVFLSIFPITAPLTMIMRIAISAVPFWQLALSISLLTLSAIGAMWLAGRIFRVNVMLAGQMPKLRDLVRLVREG